MAKQYDKFRGVELIIIQALVNEIKSIDNQTYKIKFLDLGCGTGSYSHVLHDILGIKVSGIDISEEMLSQAKIKIPDADWIKGDIQTIDLKTNAFDVILLSYVIQHLTDPLRVYQKAFNALKSGGKLFIVTDAHEEFSKSAPHKFMPMILEIDLKRFPQIKNLEEMLIGVGFKVYIKKLIKTVEVDQENYVSKLEERFRARYISTLTLISKKDIEEGIKKMKSYYEVNPIEASYLREYTLVVASR